MGGAPWLSAFKRAFMSPPTTDNTTTPKHGNHQPKKREKRSRWLFRKSSNNNIHVHVHQSEQDMKKSSTTYIPLPEPQHTMEPAAHQKHAVSLAAATIKAAEAAVTTAQAAAHIIRFTTTTKPSPISLRQHFAAVVIQTAFRGYLARRALNALKGIVMLQAVIRGQNVRKQATITLKCMQALLRVQGRLQNQRSRLTEYGARKSMFVETAHFWESNYFQDIRHRKSTSRDGSCIPDDWSDIPHTLEELDAILQSRKQTCRNPSMVDEKEVEDQANWLDRWMEAKQWESQRSSRASYDRRDSIKTLQIDNSRPYSRSATGIYRSPHHASHYIPNSPSRRASYSNSISQQPVTPSPIKTKPLQVRSASPRCIKEERSYFNANVQSLWSTPHVNVAICHYSTCANDMVMPNYMAATESAKARIRSQSMLRQRPSTPERERPGTVKKRLAYPAPVPEPCDHGSDNYKTHNCGFSHNLRSPSFKSVQAGHVGLGQQSCYADSTGGEISPCSTSELRRWLR